MSAIFAVDGRIGANFDAGEAAQTFTLGERVETNKGTFMYVKNGANALTDGMVVIVTSATFDVDYANLTTTNAKSAQKCGVVTHAVAASEYFWVMVSGQYSINVLTSAAANVVLNSTATNGSLDDDAAVGSEVITGIELTAAESGGKANAMITEPVIGATL